VRLLQILCWSSQQNLNCRCRLKPMFRMHTPENDTFYKKGFEHHTKYRITVGRYISDKALEWLNANISHFHTPEWLLIHFLNLFIFDNEWKMLGSAKKNDICLFCDHDFCKRKPIELNPFMKKKIRSNWRCVIREMKNDPNK
jgi:hypothetical protein